MRANLTPLQSRIVERNRHREKRGGWNLIPFGIFSFHLLPLRQYMLKVNLRSFSIFYIVWRSSPIKKTADSLSTPASTLHNHLTDSPLFSLVCEITVWLILVLFYFLSTLSNCIVITHWGMLIHSEYRKHVTFEMIKMPTLSQMKTSNTKISRDQPAEKSTNQQAELFLSLLDNYFGSKAQKCSLWMSVLCVSQWLVTISQKPSTGEGLVCDMLQLVTEESYLFLWGWWRVKILNFYLSSKHFHSWL